MDRTPKGALRLGAVGLLVLTASACSAVGSSVSPAASAMAEHSTMPSASAMMEHSAAPSASAMMEHSAAPSVTAPVSTGMFHAVDGTATGTVALFHKPDGTFAITFEDFSVASNAHTNVILVTNKDVTKDGDIDKAAIVDLGPLKGTSGMQDFVVPSTADAMTYHTVVLWDTEMTHPIAAAPLQ
jgi:hypothetical protein